MNQLTTADLTGFARNAMIANGFLPDFPQNVIEAVNKLEDSEPNRLHDPLIRDLRQLLWSSIDDKSTRDLDQVEYVETLPGGEVRLLIGIAEVDEFVPQGSVIDNFAARNTVSIYAGNRTFPLLPEKLSTDLTSLLNDADRLAVVIEMVIAADGEVRSNNVYRALVRNYAKLSYEEIGVWLDENAPLPVTVETVRGLEAQIRLQRETASRLHKLRQQHGALEFETVETSPVIVDGNITEIKTTAHNSARDIIENFMIAANVAMAEFLEANNVISLRRVVKDPERWERIVEIAQSFGAKLPAMPDSQALSGFLLARKTADPAHFPDLSLSIIKLLGAGEYVVQLPNEEVDGHFGLAVRDYAHSTAPNRRYADLITQRLVKSVLQKQSAPYNAESLTAIAAHCNERASAARKVERQMRKMIAASVLASRVGEEFTAIVTGVKSVGTFARLLNPPADGRIVRGEAGLQVGEKIRVRLVETNPQRGFLDFAFEG